MCVEGVCRGCYVSFCARPTCLVRQVRRRKKPTNKGKPAPKRGVRSLLYSTDWVKVRWRWVGVGYGWEWGTVGREV